MRFMYKSSPEKNTNFNKGEIKTDFEKIKSLAEVMEVQSTKDSAQAVDSEMNTKYC